MSNILELDQAKMHLPYPIQFYLLHLKPTQTFHPKIAYCKDIQPQNVKVFNMFQVLDCYSVEDELV